MALLVQKYGGSSLLTPTHIQGAARNIASLCAQGHQVVVVVSAMGKTTDQLLALAREISPSPQRRELDMLLTTGERISMALLSMALHDLKVTAISFTGSQAGVFTDGSHSNARITELKPIRVQEELRKNRVVVLAGFQGVHPETREITTLGRGGSDTTAVAMAAYLQAERCEIRKDVEGVFSADPKIVTDAHHLAQLSYEQMLEMTFWGAKVLHYRSVELAAQLDVPLIIALAHGTGRETLIHKDIHMYESTQILSVNSHEHVARLQVPKLHLNDGLTHLGELFTRYQLPWPQVLSAESSGDHCEIWITAPADILASLQHRLRDENSVRTEFSKWSTVTLTCAGASASALPAEMVRKLADEGILAERVQLSSTSVTVFIEREQRSHGIRCLHQLVG